MSAAAMTLYHLSEDLTAYLESIDLTEPGTPERAECETAIQVYMEQLPAKVDSVAAMLVHLESQAKMAGEEIKRLTARKQAFERAHERLAAYCVRVLELLPEPKKGPRKLEGVHSTLALRPSEAVTITDEPSIPAAFKTACVEMPAVTWEDLVRIDPSIIGKLTKQDLQVRRADVKKAIQGGESVPGADLEFRSNLRLL